MNFENPTPDTSAGQGSGAPESGQAPSAAPESDVTGQGTPIDNSNNVIPENFVSRDQYLQAQRKITEQGQTLSQVQQQLQQQQQTEEQRRQALGQYLGYNQPQAVDPVTRLLDNPEAFLKEYQESATEGIRNEVAELKQQLAQKDASEYIMAENAQKEVVRQQLLSNVTPEVANQMLDISGLVDPKLIELNNSIQNNPALTPEQKASAANELNMEFSRALQVAGGYQGLVERRAGQYMLNNFKDIMQSGAKVIQQTQMGANRTNVPGHFGNSAGMANAQGSGGYKSETIYR